MAHDTSDDWLRGLVERHKVCWDAFPEWSQIDRERRQTGVVVELYGTHDEPGVVPTAGCRHCFPVIQDLLAVADYIAESARQELVSIRAHSGIEYANERGARPDIVVALTFSLPDESRSAAPPTEVRGRLEALGVSARSWR
ncbi:MAG TPA: hypothetical protein VEL05_04930 [Candidatus Acidoferrum sp.]|nr:hypothetical protein [Candidatus Acidoferrum sp.]